MQNNMFDEPEKAQEAVKAFKDLQQMHGWELLVQVLDANIDIFRDKLETSQPGQTLAEIEETRLAIALCRWLQTLPESIVARLSPDEADPDDTSLSPYYDTMDQLIKARKSVTK